jgi:hypothetical protein
MSNRWPGGVIRKTPVTPTGPFQNGAASGVWSLADAAYWTKQGLWPLAGNTPPAIEDYFSTYLYTGNGGTQTITNGIDLAGENGMVWIKNRTSSSDPLHYLNFKDGSNISSNNSNNTSAKQVMTPYAAFNSNGFTVNALPGFLNNSGVNYASWTFRKAPKFFDVVTYTGDGANRNIAHNLGVAPGMIIVKRTDTTGAWQVYHRSNANTQYMVLNTTAAVATGTTRWNSTTPTATEFTVGTDATVNASGGTYVAYLYAHDTASTGLIQCGTYTETGSAVTVNLGWEPQWLMVKRSDSTGNWVITDNMRAFNMSTTNGAALFPNLTNAETNDPYWHPTATGFVADPYYGSGASVIYVAIRRGPMRTPTLGTSVFMPWTRTGTGTTTIVSSTTFPPDLLIAQQRSAEQAGWFDRLRGRALSLTSAGTGAEATTTTTTNDLISFNMNGITVGANQQQSVNTNGAAFIDWNFRRAPGFMDEVCYTGTSVAGTQAHNLGVVPEMIIIKDRIGITNWTVYTATTGTGKGLYLNSTSAEVTFSQWVTSTSSTTFGLGTGLNVNGSGDTYVAYLFASCPGVSKVGSYTGTGALQTINCAFTTGARFVLIKRTDSTGDWFVWDSARGIVAGNDPYLLWNSTAAEVTGTNYVDTDPTGFKVTAAAPAGINASGGTYIFLAIA